MEVWSSKKVPGTEAGWADWIRTGRATMMSVMMIVNDGHWAIPRHALSVSGGLTWRQWVRWTSGQLYKLQRGLHAVSKCFEYHKGLQPHLWKLLATVSEIMAKGHFAVGSNEFESEHSRTDSVHVAENRASLVPLLEEIPSNRGSGVKSILNISKS